MAPSPPGSEMRHRTRRPQCPVGDVNPNIIDVVYVDDRRMIHAARSIDRGLVEALGTMMVSEIYHNRCGAVEARVEQQQCVTPMRKSDRNGPPV
jgi:hypothetical protein